MGSVWQRPGRHRFRAAVFTHVLIKIAGGLTAGVADFVCSRKVIIDMSNHRVEFDGSQHVMS